MLLLFPTATIAMGVIHQPTVRAIDLLFSTENSVQIGPIAYALISAIDSYTTTRLHPVQTSVLDDGRCRVTTRSDSAVGNDGHGTYSC
jgi:hypothetical protein